MKKITALLLALLLALSLCTMGAAADETVTIVLEPADDTLLTAEGLALFFVDRAAVKEETETSVSWYKETTANGKTERELIEEMPLVIRPGKGRSATRIYVADGYQPPEELIDAIEKYAPKKDTSGTHHYCMHRTFGQSCLETGLRYGTCWHCLGIEFDLARGPHRFGAWVDLNETQHEHTCTVCGVTETEIHAYSGFTSKGYAGHVASCSACGHGGNDLMDHQFEETGREWGNNCVRIHARCTLCGYTTVWEIA